jgi:peptidyl-prolyl cis-trans isomerase SurA
MKKRFLLSLIVASTLYAGVVDGVSLIVNGKVITMYEIVSLSELNKIPRERAIEALVEKRLEEAELTRQNINVDDFDVERKIEQIASSNGLSLSQFRDALGARFINYAEYKSEIKTKIAKERFFQKITHEKYAPMDEKDLRLYFENNKKEFAVPSRIEALQYSAKDRSAIERAVSSPMTVLQGVLKEEIVINTKTLDPALIYVFKNTKEGSFTQIMPIKDRFVSYYIKDKKDFVVPEFEGARNEVFEKLTSKKEEDAVKDYFEKLKASAKIKVVRLPN